MMKRSRVWVLISRRGVAWIVIVIVIVSCLARPGLDQSGVVSGRTRLSRVMFQQSHMMPVYDVDSVAW